MQTKLTVKEKQVLQYIKKHLNPYEFMVYEIFSDILTDDEINGVIGSLTKKGILDAEVKGIFKLNKFKKEIGR